ncbi:PDZ domain-containing protein [Streptomyces sp. NPDC006552]|uniref:PDZ domain-containing protein n=1 Tax=Streptomyces sp. NPDC006552 TaxID=3157179 RepID=UPI0033A202A9
MEQTALRAKPMPGTPAPPEPGGATEAAPPGPAGRRPGRASRPVRRPHAARRRGRRLLGLVSGLACALVLVLAGVGLGTVGATVIGMSKLAELRQQTAAGTSPQAPSRPAAPPAVRPSGTAAPAALRGSLGVEVVDAPGGPGALVVAVHVPGPGYAAGLVRGDVLLRLGAERVASAGDLATLVAKARPGHRVPMTVRHAGGTRQQLSALPGVLT